MKTAVIGVSAFLLAGCGVYLPYTPDQRLNNYQTHCEGAGYDPGSEAYANCVFELERAYLSGSTVNAGTSSSGTNYLCKWAIQGNDANAIAVHC